MQWAELAQAGFDWELLSSVFVGLPQPQSFTSAVGI